VLQALSWVFGVQGQGADPRDPAQGWVSAASQGGGGGIQRLPTELSPRPPTCCHPQQEEEAKASFVLVNPHKDLVLRLALL
jgi:hypothetical protein